MKKIVFALAFIFAACVRPDPVYIAMFSDGGCTASDSGVAHALTPAEIAALNADATAMASGTAAVPLPIRITHIMALGDSVTLDALYATGGSAYRGLMYASAVAAGKHIAFVGQVQTGPNLNYGGGVANNGFLMTDTAVVNGPYVWHNGVNSLPIVASYSGGTSPNSISVTTILNRQVVSNLMPEIVLFEGGYNDTIVYGTGGATAAWSTAAGLVIDQVHTQSLTTQIFVTGMTVVGACGVASCGNYNDAVNYAPYRALLKTAAQASLRSSYTVYIDLAALLTTWDVTLDTQDGLHPSPAGYAKINAVVWPIVNPYVAQ